MSLLIRFLKAYEKSVVILDKLGELKIHIGELEFTSSKATQHKIIQASVAQLGEKRLKTS